VLLCGGGGGRKEEILRNVCCVDREVSVVDNVSRSEVMKEC